MDRMAEFEILKREYNDIEIPEGLNEAISMGIELGKKKLHKEESTRRILSACASIAVAFALFTTAVNVSPSFADLVDDIPIIGELVKILKFVDGEASGGEITDGTDISDIAVIDDADSSKIILNFESDTLPKDNMGFYSLRYSENPSVMSVDIYGARMISAAEDFEKILESEYVKDIYTLMTLDDSLIRFNIVFKEDVSYTAEEFKNPASLVIDISRVEANKTEPIYSVRTYSYEKNEGFGILEEEIMQYLQVGDYRILKDASNGFLIEFSSFATMDEAETAKENLEKVLGIKLCIEKRGPNSDIQNIVN